MLMSGHSTYIMIPWGLW